MLLASSAHRPILSFALAAAVVVSAAGLPAPALNNVDVNMNGASALPTMFKTAFHPPRSSELPPIRPHPRLLATDADIARLNATIDRDPAAAALFADLVAYGDYVSSCTHTSR